MSKWSNHWSNKRPIAFPEITNVPEINQLAKMMEKELNDNRTKGDWRESKDINKIISELEWHKAKLLIAIKDKDKNKIKEYLADCNNELLFLGNALGVFNV